MNGGGQTPSTRPINLGLPSGLLWADTNVGARVDTDTGLFFSWGNTNGQELGNGYSFSAATYADTPGSQLETDIDLSHDAARMSLGGNWRMPSPTDFQELINNTTSRWTIKDGVPGYIFTSNVNGESIFFPAAGFVSGPNHSSYGTVVRVWTTGISTEGQAQCARMNEDNINYHLATQRYYGTPIRAVRDD